MNEKKKKETKKQFIINPFIHLLDINIYYSVDHRYKDLNHNNAYIHMNKYVIYIPRALGQMTLLGEKERRRRRIALIVHLLDKKKTNKQISAPGYSVVVSEHTFLIII